MRWIQTNFYNEKKLLDYSVQGAMSIVHFPLPLRIASLKTTRFADALEILRGLGMCIVHCAH